MPDDATGGGRLEELRRRWEAQRAPWLLLQLAEECRRADRLAEAAEVLAEGLRRAPDYLAARVALGRCWLDLGRSDAASAMLETVVARDPAQLLAAKLLVRAYLERGAAGRAWERLELYRQLHPSDPEIADLERRLERMGRGPARAGAAIFELPGPFPPPPDLLALAPPGRRQYPGFAAAPAPGNGRPGGAADPFPELARSAAGDAHLRALLAGGVFGATGPLAAGEVGMAGVAFERPEETEPASGPAPVAEPVSATLGDLYLRQGHVEEAGEIFRRVLAREPENAVARQGLAALAGVEARELTAAELLAGAPAGEGPRARRMRLLRRYLERLRGRG